jgi:flagellar hook-length control protein FliK
MSALSLPANPALSQNKPATQTNNASAAEEADTPFASVLQQKVQSSKEGQDKPAESSAAPAPAEQSQAGTSTDNAEAATPAAMAVANGDYAQNALQQLLPWLQNMQGQAAQASTSDTPVASEGLLPEALVTPQIQAQQPGLQLDPKLTQGKDTGTESAELPVDVLKDSKTANITANLAAPTDALNTSGKRAGAHESFDTALQGVHERLDAQAQSNVANSNATRSGEPVRLQAPLGTPQWQSEFSDHIQFMSRNNENRAELVLNPPQLGRIEVSLNINGDQATAMFVSANPEVRTALEGAMDRLREALANNGISLGQAHVGAESSGQSAGNEQGGQRQAGASAGGVQEAGAGTWTRHSNNMLDVFA